MWEPRARLASKDVASKIIANETSVMYKKGIWNKYKLISAEEAIRNMDSSEVGIDVSYDTDSGKFFVSMPYFSDMW